MRRVQLDRLLVARDGLLGLVEDLLEQETELQQKVELGAGVDGGLDPALVERPKLVPLLVLGVELLERGEGDGVAGLDFENALMETGAVFGDAQNDVEELRRPAAESQLDLALDPSCVDCMDGGLGEGVVLVGSLGHAAQTVEEVQVVGRVEKRGFERRVGTLGVAELG